MLALLAPLLLPAQDLASCLPPEASVVLEVPDFQGLLGCYAKSSYASLWNDPELWSAAVRLMGEEGMEPMELRAGAMASLLEMEEYQRIQPLWNDLSGLALSLSTSAELQQQGWSLLAAGESLADAWSAFGVELVLEYPSPEVAQSAVTALFQDLDVQASVAQQPSIEQTEVLAWTLQIDDSEQHSLHAYRRAARVMLHWGSLDAQEPWRRLEGSGPALQARMGDAGRQLWEGPGQSLMGLHSRLGDQLLGQDDWLSAFLASDGPLSQLLGSMLGPVALVGTRGGDWRLDFANGRFETNGRVPAASGETLEGMFGAGSLEATDLELIHPEAVLGGAFTMDAEAMAAWVSRNMASSADQAELAMYEETYGFHPIRDLVAPMGSAAVWSLQSNIGISAPPILFVARVQDPERMRKGVDGLARWIAETEGEDVAIKSRKYKGFQVVSMRNTAETGNDMDLPVDVNKLLQPTLVVMDDRVILGMNPTLAKREVKRVLAAQEELAAQAAKGEVQASLARWSLPEGGAGELVFADWVGLLGRLYSVGRSMAPMLGALAEDLPFALEDLPDAAIVTRHFAPSLEHRKQMDGSLWYQSSSDFGPEVTFGGVLSLGLAAMYFIPETMESLDEAKIGKAKADIRSLRGAGTQFAINNGGRYPKSIDQLVTPDANGRRYLAQEAEPMDPWGHPYHLGEDADGGLKIWSAGPDGVDQKGAGDDVTLEF